MRQQQQPLSSIVLLRHLQQQQQQQQQQEHSCCDNYWVESSHCRVSGLKNSGKLIQGKKRCYYRRQLSSCRVCPAIDCPGKLVTPTIRSGNNSTTSCSSLFVALFLLVLYPLACCAVKSPHPIHVDSCQRQQPTHPHCLWECRGGARVEDYELNGDVDSVLDDREGLSWGASYSSSSSFVEQEILEDLLMSSDTLAFRRPTLLDEQHERCLPFEVSRRKRDNSCTIQYSRSLPLPLAIPNYILGRNNRGDDVLQHHPSGISSRFSNRILPNVHDSHNHHNNQEQHGQELLSISQTTATKKRFWKTGTTIVGVAGADFVVLGADTRATAGRIVADKRCDKLHCLAKNVAAAGAGTAADLDHITAACYYTTVLMHQLYSPERSIGNPNLQYTVDTNPHYNNDDDSDHEQVGKQPPLHSVSVHAACRWLQDVLYEQRGACQAYLIVGGVWQGVATLRALHAHGSMDAVSYTALGSGSDCALGILEDRYRPDLTLADAIELVKDAVKAGIENDMGSGSQVDLCIIDATGQAVYIRRALAEQELPALEPPPSSSSSPQLELQSSSSSSVGVNGFGNIPFAIQSQRTVVSNGEMEIENDTAEDLLELEWEKDLFGR